LPSLVAIIIFVQHRYYSQFFYYIHRILFILQLDKTTMTYKYYEAAMFQVSCIKFT